jgi:hypothetical protein
MYLLKTDTWYLERIIFLIAGILVLASSILAWVHSIYWLILTLLVGLNLFIFAVTGFCPSAIFFDKIKVRTNREIAQKSAALCIEIAPHI